MNAQQGFSLLEVLIAALVLAIGLLGLAALQASGLQSGHASSLHSQATLLAYDIADRMRAILSAQIYTEGIGRSLPIDPEVPDAHGRTARVETKSGCLAGVWHDAGIVRRRDGAALFALAVLTADSDDRAERWEQEGLLTIGRIARLAFEAATAEEVPPGA